MTTDAVMEALAPLLADLASTAVPLPRLELGRGVDGTELVWVRLASGSAVGVWLGAADETDLERRLRVLDVAHEAVVEDLPSLGRPTNWPPCPEHPDNHPLVISGDGPDVAWACPRGGSTRIPVGHLVRG
jgi:hypothetical protein